MKSTNFTYFGVVVALLCILLVVSTLGSEVFAASNGRASQLQKQNNSNPILLENQLEGDDDWGITNPAANQEVMGYASKTSVNIGDSIDFHVSSKESSFSIKVYRLGWYDGKGARLVHGPVSVNGQTQSVSSPQSGTGLLDLDWDSSYTLNVPVTWVSGAYLVKLTNNNQNDQAYIPFIVRDDNRPADVVFQHSVTTWQAYNNFGGKSLYTHNSTNSDNAHVVSFNRPYASDFGSGELLRWEYQLIRFLEREGYNVTYVTNLDTHQSVEPLKQHKVFLSVGHDEYWSWEMRDHVEELRANGTDLGFFTANAAYWQVRFDNSPHNNVPDRIMTGYRYDATNGDPIYNDGDSSNDYLATGLFRNHPTNRPEESLIGVMYGLFPVDDEDMIITNSDHWVFENTGLNNGDVIPNILGYEVDGIYGFGPENLEILASTPLQHPTTPSRDLTSYMTVYETEYDSYVFATGTIQWSWGLDNFVKSFDAARNFESDEAKQVTRNVLDRFIGQPVDTEPTPIPTLESTPTLTITETITPTLPPPTAVMTPTVPPHTMIDINMGSPAVGDGRIDGFKSNLIINLSDIYTNTTAATQEWQISQFDFYAGEIDGPVTPFIVSVLGAEDFIIKAIGTSRTPTELGSHTFSFTDDATKTIMIEPNEVIAVGFIDA
ncbi:MAG: N,N-dimethylformamidase beta subunit family domain-containing protein, partial [Chloroflexota bacterium]